MNEPATALRHLPLEGVHLALGARMAPFAGWAMPVRYASGVMAEHLHTRAAASLFDVSHMGQIVLRPRAGLDALARALEALTPADVLGLAPGRQRYALLTDEVGGIRDDIIIANRGDHLLVVVNASMREADLATLRDGLGAAAAVEPASDRVLLALQGPGAAAALAPLLPGAAAMRFMDCATQDWWGAAIWLSRSGYTGEDGFELSVRPEAAPAFAEALLARPGVRPAGLGARDSLRLEAGLCLHGQDIDRTTTPAEAGLGFAVARARRAGGPRAGGFPGAARILRELDAGPARRRVGLRPEGGAPMRAGVIVAGADGAVGHITSGGFGPSVGGPIAMALVDAAVAATGTRLTGEVRGRALPATVAALPFHPHSYHR